jgi:hypothetical protein
MKISAPVSALFLSAALSLTAFSEVVRPAPQFAFSTAAGESRTLKEIKGQPVLLLLADSPTRSAFRAQLRELEKAFDRLSIRKTLIIAAFRQDGGGEIRSNIPVTLLPDGARVCEAYGLKGKFAIALISQDGNLDYQTEQILNINRILEVMQNSYEVQKAARR